MAYSGTGLQDNCLDDGHITFCEGVSGDGVSNVGFTMPNGEVTWIAEMAYSTNIDCSEIIGAWILREGLPNQISGTFTSDAITNCFKQINFEDFENTTTNYTTSITEFTDGSEDYFIRTDGNDIDSGINFSKRIGERYFAAQDIDGEGAASTQYLFFNDIRVSSFTTVYISAQFAEDDDGSNEDWDDSDSVKVEYSFDDVTWVPFFAIENDGSPFNSAPFVDTDLDGVGDGEEITDSFEIFRFSFSNDAMTNPTNSNSVSVRIAINLNSGDEDIAIDNIIIRGLR